MSFVPFLGTFLVAILLGMVSHVPGGLGVFEGLMVLLLKPYLSSAQLLPALVVYRAVYYLLPLTVAMVGLVADEVRQRRAHMARAGALLGQLTEQLTPRLLAVFTFLSGLVLLFSGATPAAAGRLDQLSRVLPLGVIEASHFLGSVAGAAAADPLAGAGAAPRCRLLPGRLRRLSREWSTSLLKGFDYEEAVLLLVVWLVLWRGRPAFDRRAAFFDTRFSGAWIAALAGGLAASVWLGVFAFKHVNYSHELWWQFEIQGEASRFLRASVGAAVVLLLAGFARLIGYAPHEAPAPTDADLEDAGKAIAAQTSTFPFLVYLRDKALLFNDDRTALLMYGVQGRTWVAMGDPVGPEDRLGDLVRCFLERCDDFGGVPVFYEVGKTHLHRYADFGLTFVKLGEEAIVDLTTFTLEGGPRRQVPAGRAPAGEGRRLLSRRRVGRRSGDHGPAARRVRRLACAKAARRKGFSLGFFVGGVSRAMPRRRRRARGRNPGVREHLAGSRPAWSCRST